MRLVSRQPKSGVRVSGVEDMLVRFGKCCQPLPGERIAGFITRGRGVTVHALDCPKVLESDPQRRIDVQWENGKGTPRAVAHRGDLRRPPRAAGRDVEGDQLDRASTSRAPRCTPWATTRRRTPSS